MRSGPSFTAGTSAGGGEWIECRLLASGPRTNPWFRECSMRVIERGDIVAFDTDLIGPYGYCSDISRTWVCDSQPTDEQRRLYAEAYAHIQENKALLKPGVTFDELTRGMLPLGEEFAEQRYVAAMHGVGLCDEYPVIPLSRGLGARRRRRAAGGDGVLPWRR